jgi:hypothetical protein
MVAHGPTPGAGYAVVGLESGPAEPMGVPSQLAAHDAGGPMPIGVMRTNYSPATPPAAAGPIDPMAHGQRGPGGMAAGMTNIGSPGSIAAWHNTMESGGWSLAPSEKRPSVMAKMLGLPDFSGWGQKRKMKKRAMSAPAPMAMPMQAAPSGPLTEVPASLIYR